MRPNYVALFLLTFALSSVAQTKPKPGESITGTGCVRAGVEAGCLMIEGKQNKAINGLFDPANKPAVETMIRYTGVKHSGPTICMQGPAFKITKWEALKMKCPKPKDKISQGDEPLVEFASKTMDCPAASIQMSKGSTKDKVEASGCNRKVTFGESFSASSTTATASGPRCRCIKHCPNPGGATTCCEWDCPK